jgi:monoamine oxidase
MPVRSRFWLRKKLAPTGSSDQIGLLWEGTDNQNLPPDAPALLTLFLGGGPANAISTSRHPRAFALKRLTPLYAELPAEMNGNDYLANWLRTDFIGGGYSCPAPNCVRTTVKALHDGTRQVFFAGEHVAMPFFGYMEGALYTGLRAAHKIAASCGLREAQNFARYRASIRSDLLRKPPIDARPFSPPHSR